MLQLKKLLTALELQTIAEEEQPWSETRDQEKYQLDSDIKLLDNIIRIFIAAEQL
jgi:uncharacterized phage-associated protein